MPALRAYVANCLIGGETMTQSGSSFSRNRVTLSCGGFTFLFIQCQEVVLGQISQFEGRHAETTQVVVENVEVGELPKVLKILGRICWLLSFAGMSRVVPYGYDFPDGRGNASHSGVVGFSRYFRPTLEIRDGAVVRNFVEQTYPNFARLEKRRKLPAVIDYLVQSDRPNQPSELRLITVFALLENLKDTYAKSKSFPYIGGAYRTSPGARSPKYTFQQLLCLMLKDVKMKKGLKRVKDLRNEVNHSGLSHLSHRSQWAMYERIQDLLREYLLRLLGFRGMYFKYSSAGSAPAAV